MNLTLIRGALAAAHATLWASSLATTSTTALAVIAPLTHDRTVLGGTSGDWWLAALLAATVLAGSFLTLPGLVDAETAAERRQGADHA